MIKNLEGQTDQIPSEHPFPIPEVVPQLTPLPDIKKQHTPIEVIDGALEKLRKEKNERGDRDNVCPPTYH